MEQLPLSLLNDFLYCPRRAALKLVEGWRSANEHTARGDIVHEHADLPGYEVAKGVTLLRALPVWSERLGLNGKCDLVEIHSAAAEVTRLNLSEPENGDANLGAPTIRSASSWLKSKTCESGDANPGRQLATPPVTTLHAPLSLLPVEFKLGKRRKWVNDDAQLCAQALCLEEMFHLAIPRGAVFHADSKRRRDVEFTVELRQRTEDALRQLHALLDSESVPPAEYREACQECSLFDICLPRATGIVSRAAQLAGQLFKT